MLKYIVGMFLINFVNKTYVLSVSNKHSFLKHSFNFCLANIVGKLDFIPISLLNNPRQEH
jgi:hypothetical protein